MTTHDIVRPNRTDYKGFCTNSAMSGPRAKQQNSRKQGHWTSANDIQMGEFPNVEQEC